MDITNTNSQLKTSINVFEIQTLLGNQIIYPEQNAAAEKILSIFADKDRYPLLVCGMQGGKTNTGMAVVDMFIKKCKFDNVKYQVIWLNHIADNVLKVQTEQRLLEAGLSDDVTILHHGNIKNFVPETDCVTLLILDECHVALDIDKPLDNFFKKLGINYGQRKSIWKNQQVSVLSISATPYAHCIKNCLDENIFCRVDMIPSSSYFSIQKLAEKNRIFQSHAVIDNKKKEVTKFFIEQIDNFIDRCKTEGNGYFLVRSKGDGPEIIQKYIQNVYGNSVCFKEFSNEKGNIDRLDSYLSIATNIPKIYCIRGSLRAGKTLNTTKNIRGWIESPNAKSDANMQVIGRSCGYPSSDGHSKELDTYPIFCNKRDIDIAISFYNDNYIIPRGNNNKSTVYKKKNRKYVLYNSLADIPTEDGENPADWQSSVRKNIGTKITKEVLCKRIFKNVSHGDRRVIVWDVKNYEEFYKLINKAYEEDIISLELKTQHLEFYKKCIEKFNIQYGQYLNFEGDGKKIKIEKKPISNDLINSETILS